MQSWKAHLSSKRVLITGATGFIGANLIPLLHELGAEVHGSCLSQSKRGSSELASLTATDLRIEKNCEELIDKVRPDVIFHLASLVTGARDLSAIVDIMHSNLCSTVYLMRAANSAGAQKMIIAGSLEEPKQCKISNSPYAASKAATRLYAELFNDAGSLRVNHVGIGMVYGPRQWDQQKLVPYVINAILNDEVAELTSGGSQADWTYVGDIVEGLARIASDTSLPASGLPLGTGKAVSVREVVEHLVRISGKDARIAFGKKPDRRNESASIADVRSLDRSLAWYPNTSLSEGLAETYRWFLAEHHAQNHGVV